MPKVTVIIPNYNHARYLVQRIDSVLSQTYTDFEVIILDDCSADNSRQLIENYRHHPKVTGIVYNEQNSGNTFLQWKIGIALAKGEWIWMAESDDWCEPTLLETLMSGAGTGCNLSFCQSVIINEKGEPLSLPAKRISTQTIDGKLFVRKWMLQGNAIVNASMCIFRRSAFANVGESYLDYKFCGDWLVWILISVQGDVFISGEYLNYFRKHSGDVSNVSFRSGLYYYEYSKLVDELEKKLITKGDKEQLLVGKYKEFLQDDRIDPVSRKSINAHFRKSLSAGFHILMKAFSLKQYFTRWKA